MSAPHAEGVLGAWVVFGWDWNPYPISLWPDELSARRAADQLGYGEVSFWPWGEFSDRKAQPVGLEHIEISGTQSSWCEECQTSDDPCDCELAEVLEEHNDGGRDG